MSEITVAEAALAALAARRDEQDAEREKRMAKRAAEDAAADRECLEWVTAHPWIMRYVPGRTWVLIDRRFPQATAVVHPEGEPEMMLVVTRDHHDYVTVPRRGADKQWLVNGRRAMTLADVGQCIYDDERATRMTKTAEDPS